MIVCIICLEEYSSSNEGIEIFSEEGVDLDVPTIISKHFWFEPKNESEQYICIDCWKIINTFHEFYQRIVRIHSRFELHLPYVMALSEKDPLPGDDLAKSIDDVDPGPLESANFFHSEVKVEVNDLDLLPKIEVIDDAISSTLPMSKTTTTMITSNDRTERASRRGHRTDEMNSPSLSPLPNKMIKREDSPNFGADGGDETESELPLDMLLGGGTKAEIDYGVSENITKEYHNIPEIASQETSNPLGKKRRGRPKKIKDQSTEGSSSMEIKTEHTPHDASVITEKNKLIGLASSSADSASSSESLDTDDSLPDFLPEEKYATIPKRVVLKPKKYRKRPTRVVPARRMTREEINRKKTQQAEYDKVIAQFFDKFCCPKCDLLVKNFGEMCQHFRLSHNCDPGYMTCCGRKFHQRKTLAEHVYVHWNPEHFKCSTCGRVFQDARGLEVHEQTHTKPPESKDKKVFQCDKCPKAFTTKAAFEYHSFSKHVPKSEFKFTCQECNKKLPTERKLKDHMKYMHDPESAIICDKCGKQVRSQSNLKKHHQIEHSDVPRPAPVPMQCEICGTWLRHLAGLKQHMKTIHEDSGGEHRCPICNKTSTNARALKRHIYHNHECERKFKCTMCEKAFKRPQDLREHTSTHTGEVLYTCPNCPMTFFSNANMYKHRQRLHRAEWEADKKKPVPPNIMQQAVGATAAMKMQQAVGATTAFFGKRAVQQQIQIEANMITNTTLV